MKNFKEYFKSKKTIVYHVSPKSSIKILRATGSHRGQQSYKMGASGIYVAPKFRDAVAWATSYVGGKKRDTQKPNERLKEKGTGGGVHGEKGPTNYNFLTIYKIELPEELLKNSWSNSFWEPEYFIPEEHMDKLKIIESKTYSLDELVELYKRRTAKRSEVVTKDLILIRRVSKTNLAAKYYLQLLDTYNNSLLKGKKRMVFNDEDLIHQKIEKFKSYVFFNDNNWQTKIIKRLSKQQIIEVDNLYEEIKLMIEKL